MESSSAVNMQINLSRLNLSSVAFGNNQPAGPSPEQIQQRKEKGEAISQALSALVPGASAYYSPAYMNRKRFPEGAYVITTIASEPQGLGSNEQVLKLLNAQGAQYQESQLAIEGVPVQFNKMLRIPQVKRAI